MQKIRLVLLLSTLIFSFSTALAVPADTSSHNRWLATKDSLIQSLRRTADNLKAMVLQNQENDRKGLSHLNRYVLTDSFDSLAISDEDYLRKLGDMKAYAGEIQNILAKTKQINGVKVNFYVILEGAVGIDENLAAKFGDSGILMEQIENTKDMEGLFSILGQAKEKLKKIGKDAFDKNFNVASSEGYRLFRGVLIEKLIQLVQAETRTQINCYFQGAFYYLDKLTEELEFGQFHYNLINGINYPCLDEAIVSENLDMILKILEGADCEDLVGKGGGQIDGYDIAVWIDKNVINEKFNDMTYNKTIFTINMNITILDLTGLINLEEFAQKLNERLTSASVNFKSLNIEIDYIYKPSIVIAKSMDEVKNSSVLLVIVDDVLGKADQTMIEGSEAGGIAVRNGKICYIENGSDNFSSESMAYLTGSAIHELGHNLGLKHYEEDKLGSNYMSYGNAETQDHFTVPQMAIIVEDLKKVELNRKNNYDISKITTNNFLYHTSTNEEPFLFNVLIGDKIPLIIVNNN